MSVDVDGEGQLPLGLRGGQIRADGDSGIGQEEIDRSERIFGHGDEVLVAILGSDVDGNCDGAPRAHLVERVDQGGQPAGVQVGGDDIGAFGVETPGERPPDPVRCTGDDDVTSFQFHPADGRRHTARSPWFPVRCTKRAPAAKYGLGTATAARRQGQMTDTNEAVIAEALGVIDKALAQMLRRELVSSGEVTDVLLDVRTLLTLPAPVQH